MAHEIYYTSAPEGLRPGDRGFCTVGATEGIPRLLWDRLEALSGYRHHVDANMGRNPICQAHWVLQLSGQDYHVLSRVCDAGLDYTQRTNSLAHHIVLEPGELAAGGPAWLLSQPGVMLERWDGQVGPIVRRTPLPRGDARAGVCSNWERLTDDAGWAGVVAQAIAATPWKPVGLKFSAEQAVLPLIAEVTALLPSASRWQVTFNTYFTNLPGGMTCQWRCCLEGTPSTPATLRSAAASGLVIDLTQSDAMGLPPDSVWVEAARSGRIAPAAAKTLPAASVPPAKSGSPTLKPPTIPNRAGIAAAEIVTPMPAEIFQRTEEAVLIHRGGLVGTQNEAETGVSVPIPEFSWMAQRRKARKRQLMAVYALACCAIAAGFWMSLWAYRSSSDHPLPPPASLPVATAPPTVEPDSTPPPVLTPEPVAPPEKPLVETPIIRPPAVLSPAAPPTVVIPSVPVPSAGIVLDPLPSPGAGMGLRNVTGTVVIPAGEMDHPGAIAALSIAFPDGARQWQFKQGDLDGVFSILADGKSARPHFILSWRDGAGLGGLSPVAEVVLEQKRSRLAVTWNNTTLLRVPQVVQLGYWVLENSTLILTNDIDGHTQQITFARVPIKPTKLADPDLASVLPENLPMPPHFVLGETQPDGWLAGMTLAADVRKDAAIESDEQVLRVEKPPGSAGVVPGFTLRYSASHRTLSSDLGKVIELATAELATRQADSLQAKDNIRKIRDGFGPGTTAIEQNIKDWKQRQASGDKDPQPGDLTHQQFQTEIDKLQQDLHTQAANLETQLAPERANQKTADDRIAALNTALAEYGELKELDLLVELPQGLHVGTARLMRDPN